MRRAIAVWATTVLLAAAFPPPPARADDDPAAAVERTERAFAATMARRDHAAFTEFLSPEAVFLSGSGPLRGRERVAAAWSRYFEGDAAPFSWEPARVEVLDSGGLALSTGPVRDPAGTVIGEFTSIWRLEDDGAWRIVFDRGNDVCEPPD